MVPSCGLPSRGLLINFRSKFRCSEHEYHGLAKAISKYSVLNRAERPKISLMGYLHRSGLELLIAQAMRGKLEPTALATLTPKYVSIVF